MPKPAVFISYRRRDASGYIKSLYAHLASSFGKRRVFADVEAMPLGVDFREVIKTKIAGCDVVLVLIGPNWLTFADGSKALRILEDGDIVRAEIAAAFGLNRYVLPVLVGGAQMPNANQLPEDIRSLAFLNAFELSDRHFKADLVRLDRQIFQHTHGRPPILQLPAFKALVLVLGMLGTGAFIFFRIAPPPDAGSRDGNATVPQSSVPHGAFPVSSSSASNARMGEISTLPESFTPTRTERAIKAIDELSTRMTFAIMAATPSFDPEDMARGSTDFEVQKRMLNEIAKYGKVTSRETRKQVEDLMARSQGSLERSQNRLEFLERVKRPSEKLADAKRALLEYSKSSSEGHWRAAWSKLRDAQFEINLLVKSTPWRRVVPESQSAAVVAAIRRLESEALLPNE